MDYDKTTSLQRFCRVCMASPATEDFTAELYSHKPNPDQPTLGVMLGIVCSTVFLEVPGHPYDAEMPLRACQPCERAIVDAYRLHQQCIETDRKLRELLMVKQEPLINENDCFEEITEDPILDFEVAESGVKVEEQGDGESMSESELSALKVKKRTSPRKKRTVIEVKKSVKEPICKRKNGSTKKPDRRNQKRVHATCEYCSESFVSYVRLNKHLEQNHPDRIHRCEICQTIFLNEEQYEEHRQFHITGKKFCCRICGKRFKLNKSLDGHMSTHTNVEPSPCPECGKMFKNADSLRNHILRHNKQQTFYPCAQCPVKTTSMVEVGKTAHFREPLIFVRSFK